MIDVPLEAEHQLLGRLYILLVDVLEELVIQEEHVVPFRFPRELLLPQLLECLMRPLCVFVRQHYLLLLLLRDALI